MINCKHIFQSSSSASSFSEGSPSPILRSNGGALKSDALNCAGDTWKVTPASSRCVCIHLRFSAEQKTRDLALEPHSPCEAEGAQAVRVVRDRVKSARALAQHVEAQMLMNALLPSVCA